MTLVSIIEKMVEWLNESVCSQIQLKVPDDYRNDGEYAVEYIHPTAFPLFIPGKEQLPPHVAAPFPSICVQFLTGKDDTIKRQRKTDIQLNLACWNPGEHGNELYRKIGVSDDLTRYQFYRETNDTQAYQRNMAGWRDIANFTDIVLREVESTEYIKGMRVIKEEGVKFGMFADTEELAWFSYPYWTMYVAFTLESGTTPRVSKEYESFL